MSYDYDRMASEYAAHRELHPTVLAELLAACRNEPGFSVCEVGCGTGNYIVEIASAGAASCFGVDPSEQMLEIAKKRSEKVSFKPGAAEKLDFPDGFLDLHFSVYVIHHVRSSLDYFKEAFRVVRPGGRVCVATDSEWIIKNRLLSKYFPETVPIELGRYHAISTLRVNMKAAGFVSAVEKAVEARYKVTDLSPFRERVFSALRLIPRRSFEAGLEKMESDLKSGPIKAMSRYMMIWGNK